MNIKTLAAAGAVLVLSAVFTQAQQFVGTAFTYQGSLAAGGQPANGFYDLQFAIYDSPVSGNQVAPALTNSVGVTNGLFTTTLDFGPGVFGGDACWLDIAVRTNGGSAFTPLAPRQALTPVPYALTATQVIGLIDDAQLSDNVARLNANQTFSGTVTFGPAAGPPFIIPPIYTNVIVSNLNAGNADTVDGKHAKDFWQLAGNAGTTAGTDFLGTTDNQPLEFKVNNTRVLRFEPNAASPNVLEGFSGNFVQGGIVGAAIGGGGTAGSINQIWSDYSTIGGGVFNQILPNSTDGTIGGGSQNNVGDADSTIGGGQQNGIAPGAFKSTVGGGSLNSVASKYSVVSGGNNNSIMASGAWDAIGGGGGNTIQGPVTRGTIAGGGGQTISAQSDSATIAGGQNNLILTNAQYSAIGGGFTNVIGASAFYATIPGGVSNEAFGTYSFAAGQRAQALHNGTFVWADSTAADFTSTANNQFLIRAWGGVGIGKNNPATALDVNGTVTATSFNGTYQGSGSGLTNVSASGLSGLVPGPALGGIYPGLLQCPNTGNSFAGTFSGNFDGNGSGLANVPAASLVGTVPSSALSGTYSAPLTFSSSGNSMSGMFHGGFSGDGSGLTNIIATNTFNGGSYWGVSGNTNIASTNFLGTADNNALEIRVNSARVLRLEPNATCPNFIGGYSGNNAAANTAGVTIGGGGANSSVNSVAANFTTIGGGEANMIGADGATIGGGRTNLILSGATSSTIGGGEASAIQSNAVQCTIGGGYNNIIQTNCAYSTIAGGHGNACWQTALSCVIGGGAGNTIWSNTTYSTISGGTANYIETSASSSTIGGGQMNTIFPTAPYATISGGMGNSIQPGSGYSIIPGGSANSIAGQYSFAAGRQATVNNNGCFLWADSQNAAFNSAANDEAAFRCQGGVRFTSGVGGGVPNQTIAWAPGSAGWLITSDRDTKENMTPVDPRSVLDKLSQLPLSEWNYKGYPQRHLGPMAQDFHAQFPLNDSDTTLNEADLHGVALAAIQGLNQKLEAELETVRAQNAQLQHRLERLEQLLNARNGGAQ